MKFSTLRCIGDKVFVEDSSGDIHLVTETGDLKKIQFEWEKMAYKILSSDLPKIAGDI